jgi:hypothetical protein
LKNIDLAVEANRRFGSFFIALGEGLGVREDLWGMYFGIFANEKFEASLEKGGLERFPVGVMAIIKSYLKLKTIYPEMRFQAAPVEWDRDRAVDIVGWKGEELAAVFSVKGVKRKPGQEEVVVYDLDNADDYQDLMAVNMMESRRDRAKSRESGLRKISKFGQDYNCKAFWVDASL